MDPNCLSAEHHDNPQNPVLHYLGCLEFCKREAYFDGLPEKQKSQIEVSLRRTEYLRFMNSDDKRVTSLDKHLQEGLKNLRKSFKEWRGSESYKNGIVQVKAWSGGRKQEAQRYANPTSGRRSGSYDPDYDTNAYLIQYKNSMPVNDLKHLGPGLSSRSNLEFPNHKIAISKLFDPLMTTNPLHQTRELSKGDEDKKSDKWINYFHLPSNNMDVGDLY